MGVVRRRPAKAIDEAVTILRGLLAGAAAVDPAQLASITCYTALVFSSFPVPDNSRGQFRFAFDDIRQPVQRFRRGLKQQLADTLIEARELH